MVGTLLSMRSDVLDVQNLNVSFQKNGQQVDIIRDLSLKVGEGEILALVGESGSGKSLTALAIMGLIPQPPGLVNAQSISLNDWDGSRFEMTTLSTEGIRQLRGNKITMVFQEPMVSLNPTMTVGAQIAEVLRAHLGKGRRTSRIEAIDLLEQVGIPDPATRANSYPHELSGGMRQRAMVAIALSCRPRLLIADEPTTALDVTVQAQILELITGLRDQYGMAVIFITHDLGVVAETADRVVVMYSGEIIEQASTGRVLKSPKHPYTSGLLRSKLCLDIASEVVTELAPIPGQPPDPAHRPRGCAFQPRCDFADPGLCNMNLDLAYIEDGERAIRCHRWEEVAESLVVL